MRALAIRALALGALSGLLLAGCDGAGDSNAVAGTERPRGGASSSASSSAAAHLDALRRPADRPLPNVIFIMVDTLRADRLGSYGYRRKLTPTMDAIAAEGVRFARAIAPAPWTLPSIGSVMTCVGPAAHRANNFRVVDSMDRGRTPTVPVLDDSFVTLAEALRAAGYETAGFSANKFIKPEYGMAQGFEHFDAGFAANTVPGKLVNDAALRWLDARPDDRRPLFLYLHYMDVHGPYEAEPRFADPLLAEVDALPERRPMPPRVFARINPYLRKPPPETDDPTRWDRLRLTYDYWEARYDAGVAECDWHLGRLVEQLEQRGLWDEALVILTADHGEALGEHDWWEHGYTQFQTDLHVPLILRYPGVLPAGRVAPQTASLMGLAPTIYDLLGIPLAPNVQGVSLLGHIAGAPDVQALAFADGIKYGPRQMAVVRDNWKLMVQSIPRSGGQVRQMLFDLDADPGEMRELSASEPDRAGELLALLMDFVSECKSIRPGVEQRRVAPTPEELRALEAVGYTGSSEPEEDEDGEATEDADGEAAEDADGEAAGEP